MTVRYWWIHCLLPGEVWMITAFTEEEAAGAAKAVGGYLIHEAQ